MVNVLTKEAKDLVALSFVQGLGPRSIRELLDKAGGLDGVFAMNTACLRLSSGSRDVTAEGIKAAKNSEEFFEELSYIEREGIRAVSCLDEDYPRPLKEIHDPPPVLYVKGGLLPCDLEAVAIVGARRCSMYGLRMAEKLGFELAARGVTVISGMARGIDSAAHIGALKAGGRTIAVMGSGFKNVYPRESARLAEKISRSGAVVTEFPSFVAPDRKNFPRRNRVISGLARGVVVVEAAVKSGAMITVDYALEQGREVFAVPGRADAGVSGGTNKLIQDGAKLVMGVEDVLEELQIGREPSLAAPDAGRVLSVDERAVLRVLEEEDTCIDELSRRSGLGRRAPEVLLKLEIKGFVKALPGRVYTLKP